MVRTPLAGERVRSDMHLAEATVTPVPEPSGSAAVTATPGKATALADVTVVIGRDYLTAPAGTPPPK